MDFFKLFSFLRYLGYPNGTNPVLNWENARVLNTILDSVKKFLVLGVDGFHIDHISQLALNSDGTTNVSFGPFTNNLFFSKMKL